MNLFIYKALDEVILMRTNPFLGSSTGWAHKSLQFQGTYLQMALKMDVARIKIISSRAI